MGRRIEATTPPPHASNELNEEGSIRGAFGIANRRYLGSKTKMLPFIVELIESLSGDIGSVLDVFAGTGVVGAALNRGNRSILANDLLLSNVIPLRAFLETSRVDDTRITELLGRLSSLKPDPSNYFARTFGGTYFTKQTAAQIGTIREEIALWSRQKRIGEDEEEILLTSLLYAADRCALTCGHYDAWREGVADHTRDELILKRPRIDCEKNKGNRVFHEDANVLIRELDVDVVYIDPPYNSRQYSDTYHLLENLITWKKPPVHGKARKMERRHIKSRYCSRVHAPVAFRDLIEHASCRHIFLSYNNMAVKGHTRSNALLSDDLIVEVLEARGEVELYERRYKPFSAGLRAIPDHRERVFHCRVVRPPIHQRNEE